MQVKPARLFVAAPVSSLVFVLHALDIFLTVLHIVVILFNLTGWIWKKTRRLHLVLVTLTFVSWFLLGLFFGWGYCFLTDWHWDVKHRLGETNLPSSFITYAANAVSNRSVDPQLTDMVTLVSFLVVLVITLGVNFIRSLRLE